MKKRCVNAVKAFTHLFLFLIYKFYRSASIVYVKLSAR